MDNEKPCPSKSKKKKMKNNNNMPVNQEEAKELISQVLTGANPDDLIKRAVFGESIQANQYFQLAEEFMQWYKAADRGDLKAAFEQYWKEWGADGYLGESRKEEVWKTVLQFAGQKA